MYCWSCREQLPDPVIHDYALEPWLECSLCRCCYHEIEYGHVPKLTRRRTKKGRGMRDPRSG